MTVLVRGNKDRESVRSRFEEPNARRGVRRSLAAQAARRTNSSDCLRSQAEKHIHRCQALEPLVRSVQVKRQGGRKALLEIGDVRRISNFVIDQAFESSPETLQSRRGFVRASGVVSQLAFSLIDNLFKGSRKLGSFVCYDVLGRAKPIGRGLEEIGHVVRVRFLLEGAKNERRSGMRFEYAAEPDVAGVAHRMKRRVVTHPGVTNKGCDYWMSDRRFVEIVKHDLQRSYKGLGTNTTNGGFGDGPAGASNGVRDGEGEVNPTAHIVCARERATSATRLMGGLGFAVQPMVSASGFSASFASQAEIVEMQTPRRSAVVLRFHPASLRRSRMRNLCSGV